MQLWERAWSRADESFAAIRHEALLARPLPGVAPLIYFLGHSAAQCWSALVRPAVEHSSSRPEFEDLFGRGLEGLDDTDPGAHPERASAARWPRAEEVLVWRDEVRRAVRTLLANRPGDNSALGDAARRCLEHELLAQERVLAMVQHLDPAFCQHVSDPRAASLSTSGVARRVRVPAGEARLGVSLEECPWADAHEHPERRVSVRGFTVEALPVVNGEFLEFVESGGYERAEHWQRADWSWRAQLGLRHPSTWQRSGGAWTWRGPFQEHPLTRVFDWPVSVSLAEARAFAHFKGARLLNEAEWQRAAHAGPGNTWRRFPWGAAPLDPGRARWGQPRLGPSPVGSHPAGASAFGVQELVGNGWEWVDDPQRPASDPEPNEGVLLGASWASDAALVRPGLRRRTSAHDAWCFTKFRLVWAD
ncbi:MAG: hercynine oxygenase [Planctomycetota bacterium]|nr:MAG: hercynine oxygenase [Planctomycetota bacterium]